MRRTNDLPIHDARALYKDDAARCALLEGGTLPTAPGALAVARPAVRDNDLYDVNKLRLIFYDNPFWGPYRSRFARIFATPRYHDLRANLRHFAVLYETILQRNAGDDVPAPFAARYRHYIASAAERVRAQLASLDQATERLEEAVP
jgi:hypothetical protein